jgi:hypothetical protein
VELLLLVVDLLLPVQPVMLVVELPLQPLLLLNPIFFLPQYRGILKY